MHSPDDDWDDELWHGLYHKSDSGWVFKRTDGLEIDVEMSAWLNEITFDGVVYER
ncbi:MAG: hypothetical protein R3E76_14255 [Planctomycetota bacterium]